MPLYCHCDCIDLDSIVIDLDCITLHYHCDRIDLDLIVIDHNCITLHCHCNRIDRELLDSHSHHSLNYSFCKR